MAEFTDVAPVSAPKSAETTAPSSPTTIAVGSSVECEAKLTSVEFESTAVHTAEQGGNLSEEENEAAVTEDGAMSAEEQEMLSSLCSQLEYYFSQQNLRRDAFLQSVMMQYDGYVPISIISNFSNVKKILQSYDVQVNSQWVMNAVGISEILEMVLLRERKVDLRKQGQMFGIGPIEKIDLTGAIPAIDELDIPSSPLLQRAVATSHPASPCRSPGTEKPIVSSPGSGKPLLSLLGDDARTNNDGPQMDASVFKEEYRERNVIILRDMPPETNEEDVEKLFAALEARLPIKSVHGDVANCWFVQLGTDDKGSIADAILKLRMQKFMGQSIHARLKTERVSVNAPDDACAGAFMDLAGEVANEEEKEGDNCFPSKVDQRRQSARKHNGGNVGASPVGKTTSTQHRGNQRRQNSQGKNRFGKSKNATGDSARPALTSDREKRAPPPSLDSLHYPVLGATKKTDEESIHEKREGSLKEEKVQQKQGMDETGAMTDTVDTDAISGANGLENVTNKLLGTSSGKESPLLASSSSSISSKSGENTDSTKLVPKSGYAAALLKKALPDVAKVNAREIGSTSSKKNTSSQHKVQRTDGQLDSVKSGTCAKVALDASTSVGNTPSKAAGIQYQPRTTTVWKKPAGNVKNTPRKGSHEDVENSSTSSATSSSCSIANCKTTETEASTLSVSSSGSAGNAWAATSRTSVWGSKKSFAEIVKSNEQAAN